MSKTFKLLSVAAIVAATSTAALAQQVPLNTTISGGQGAETQAGQGGVVGGALFAGGIGTAAVIGATILTIVAAADQSTNTVPSP